LLFSIGWIDLPCTQACSTLITTPLIAVSVGPLVPTLLGSLQLLKVQNTYLIHSLIYRDGGYSISTKPTLQNMTSQVEPPLHHPVLATAPHQLTTNMTASSLMAASGNSCLDEQIERLKRCEYLREGEVKALCLRAREILVDESNVQRVDAPVTVRQRVCSHSVRQTTICAGVVRQYCAGVFVTQCQTAS
jgi:hypothetical protein